jgi:hypothetical protein
MEESMMASGTQLDHRRDHRWDHRRVAMGTEVFGRPKKPRLDHDGIAIGTTRRFETGTEVFGSATEDQIQTDDWTEKLFEGLTR